MPQGSSAVRPTNNLFNKEQKWLEKRNTCKEQDYKERTSERNEKGIERREKEKGIEGKERDDN